MNRFKITVALLFTLLISVGNGAPLEGVNELPTPDLVATMAMGFNYDILRSPFRKDFDKARGYFGINVPISFKMSDNMMGSLTSGISDNFTDGEIFTPDLAVKQFANTSILVDVPMLMGVASFGHMRMMNMDYFNVLGLPTFQYSPPDSMLNPDPNATSSISLLLRGAINAPMNFSMGWETITFGYAYKFTDKLMATFNLYRHYFSFNAISNIDVDILGNLNVESDVINDKVRLDYRLQNSIDGFYELKKWRPSFGLQYGRFSSVIRLGFDGKAKGAISGGYSVPFFIDPSTFEMAELDQAYVIENYERFKNNEVTEVNFSTSNDLGFSMPHSFTFMFDIVPKKLMFSYTKLVGHIGFNLVDNDFGDSTNDQLDTLDLRAGAKVDHILLLSGRFPHIFFQFGAFSFNAYYQDQDNLLNSEDSQYLIKYGKGVLVPIVSGGASIGDKFQLMLQGDLFPLAALKTGVIYNF